MTQELSVGAVIGGRYRIEGVLAFGGAGTVYKARQTAIERAVVLEVLGQAASDSSTGGKRRHMVLRRCARLKHVNTSQMFDVGATLDGRLYVVTEFLEGASLRQTLRNEAFAPPRALRILIQCCASLEEAHRNGIVHGNLKPERVFLTQRGREPDFVKVLDYKNGRLVDEPPDADGAVSGTPAYMSPEQVRGLALDGRSDLYALGIVAYEMLTGRGPFHGDDPLASMKRQPEETVAPMAASVPEPVQQIVLRALEKDPSRRYASAGEMMQDCQRVLVALTGQAWPIGTGGTPTAGLPTQTPEPSPTGRQPSPTVTGPVTQPVVPFDAQTAKPRKGRATGLLVGAAVATAGAAVAWILTATSGGGGGDPGGVIAVGALGAAGAGAFGAAKTGAAMRRARAALARRRARRRLNASDAVSDAVEAPPVAMAYRPSWVAPRRQSAIHVYVAIPEVEARVHEEARKALDAPGNPARKAHAIALSRALAKGEVLAVGVELAGFVVGEVAPIGWRPPYVRFVVPIHAPGDVALGVHRPVVTVRRAGESGEQLARFDFDLEVREGRWGSIGKVAMIVGCGVMASAAVTATVQHSLPPLVGWPAGAACLVGGASTWVVQREAMVAADARDRSAIFVAFAPEDRERVKRAIGTLQERGVFPQVDVERVVEARQPVEAIEHAYRVFVFWSEHARKSSEVTSAWKGALNQVGVADRSFVMPIMLGQDRLEKDHPLARFDSVDLGAVVDALIVTAVTDEYEAVLAIETGAVAESAWQRREGPTRLEVAFREFNGVGGVIRIAVTQALGMGGVNAIDAAARLIDAYGVRCLAMCGVCAGRRGDVELGDVIIADRLWQYDAGKRKAAVDAEGRRTVREQGDIDMYKIQPLEWKHAAERFRIDEGAAWLAARPRSWAEQSNWILERIVNKADPATDPEQAVRCPDYDKAIARLWAKRFLADGTLVLTDAGRDHISRLLTLHRGTLPEPKPLQLHVGPIASGNKVMEDSEVFPLLADSVRKVLGVEMEAAAIGALATSSRLEFSVVMKAVMDHADADKSDNFKAFAARASAECLIAFLRQHLPPRTPPIP